jgi:hypothetical protein
MGIARVFLGCAKAAPVGLGHEHPHGKKNRLRSGHDVREARDCQVAEFPRHCRMFMAHLTGGLWHFWGSGSVGSYANRRRLRGVVSLSHAIASLEAGKSLRSL